MRHKLGIHFCKVYEKEPEMDLGEEHRQVRIGIVASPFGGFCVDLYYRTKMEINRLVLLRSKC